MPGIVTRPPWRRHALRVSAAATALVLVATACSPAADDPRPAPGQADPGPETTAPSEPSASPSPADRPPEPDDPTAEPGTPPEPEPPPLPAGRAALVARVEELLAAADGVIGSAGLSVLVTDEHGRELAAVAADEPVLPASTLKIVTAAAALHVLGPDARLATRVDATAPLDGGVIDGSLVLVGSGDPTLATPEYGRWIYPARPRTPLEDLADQLVAAGLQRVTGGVQGTAPGFAGPTEAAGWLPRYFANFDARYASGLTVDGGLATSIRWPELERERAAAEPDPATGTDAADGEAAADPLPPISIPLTGTREEVEARLAGLAPPLARVELVADPRVQAAAELARLLTERGVEVAGPATAVAGAPAVAVSGLAEVESPPLVDVLRFAVQRSDNHLTDAMFQVVGREVTGAASWDRAARAVRGVLAELGVAADGLHLADGSGLSRDDRVTARLLVELDLAMWNGPHGEIWRSLQAVAGESGTLRTRLRGTPVAGRLYGKTGTLNDVTGLTGAVVGDDGTRYHLAVIGNAAEGEDRWAVRALMDELALVLVADAQDCRIAPSPTTPPTGPDGEDHEAPDTPPASEPESGPLGRPATVVVC